MSTVAQDYMDVRAEGAWRICAYMADSTLLWRPLRGLASQEGRSKYEDCPEIFEMLTTRISATDRASTIDEEVGSFRIEGDRGFALFHGTDGMDYVLPL